MTEKNTSKKPLALSSSQRKHLRGLAHKLDPIVQIGKLRLSPTVIAEVNSCLDHHELIKVKFQDGKEERHELAAELSSLTNSVLVGLIGNNAIFYRRQSDPELRKIHIAI